MDIERLNRIREICFKKSKSRGKKRQPYQSAHKKSPFCEKENVSIDLKNQRDPLKNLEIEISQKYDMKQKRLEANIQRLNDKMKSKREKKERALRESTSRGILCRSSSTFNKRGNRFASPNGRDSSDPSRGCFSPLISKGEKPTSRVVRVKELLYKFVSFASSPAQVITQRQVDDIKLRLDGAFDRLIKYDRHQVQAGMSNHLSTVIEGCLSDLEIKLKAIALNGCSSDKDRESVREFIQQVTEQTVYIDIEEIILKIMAYIKKQQLSQGLSTIKNLIENSERRIIQQGWNQLQTFNKEKGRVNKLLKLIVGRSESKDQFGGLTRSFQSWKDYLRQESAQSTIQLLSKYAEFFKNTVTTHSISRISNYFDSCKDFISNCLQTPGAHIDLIFINNHKQALTFLQKSDQTEEQQLMSTTDDQDRERIIDLETQSLLKQYILKGLPYKVLQNSTQQSQFNLDIDSPYTNRNYQENVQCNSQMFVGLFSSKHDDNLANRAKKLKFIVRLSFDQDSLNEEVTA